MGCSPASFPAFAWGYSTRPVANSTAAQEGYESIQKSKSERNSSQSAAAALFTRSVRPIELKIIVR